MLEIIAVPAFTDNYLWVLRVGAQAAVVDPGDAAPVIECLMRERLTLAAILNTHHHRDHIGGNRKLLERWQVPVFGPQAEDIPGLTHGLHGGERIRVPGLDIEFDVLAVPGHTLGHIAYVGHGAVFCGDTLFAGGCGRLFEGTPPMMLRSLDTLAALPDDTAVYCAHEYTLSNLRFALAVTPEDAAVRRRFAEEEAKRASGRPTVPSTIGREKATNPFLRSRDPTLIAAARAHAGRTLASPVEVFAELRTWKDRF